ncbi:MAG: response regulator [Gallintestinimicrobium sp.]
MQKENVEIILCDVEMPRANGLELLEWVRNNQKEAEFLFLTSHEKFEYIFSAMQQGASDYLLKPIDISKIEQALFKVTEKVRKQKQLNEVQEYWNYGKRRILKALWRNIIFGEISGQENIFKEIEKQGLERDIGCSYILVLVLFQKKTYSGRKSRRV